MLICDLSYTNNKENVNKTTYIINSLGIGGDSVFCMLYSYKANLSSAENVENNRSDVKGSGSTPFQTEKKSFNLILLYIFIYLFAYLKLLCKSTKFEITSFQRKNNC